MNTLFASLLLLAFSIQGGSSIERLPVRMDVNHSNVGFAVPILGGLSEVHGKFTKFDMDLNFDPDDITRSNVKVSIDASSIDTGIDQRDEHLRTADFFDVEEHPTLSFASDRVEKRGDRFLLHGKLTMRGVTRDIVVPFEVTGTKIDEEKGTFVVGFKANLTLNRRDFGVNYTHQSVPGFIGDDVKVELDLISRSTKLKHAEAGRNGKDG